MSVSRADVLVRGVVQGVGFRPYVHRMMLEHGLFGRIRNSSRGVELQLEGEKADIEAFLSALKPNAPGLARIESVEVDRSPVPEGCREIEIVRSRISPGRTALISPDVATCPDCLREMHNPRDRRYRYPFINCTNCGPRFTIIEDVPYDRCRTSMSEFSMCADCAREYHEITDRRYHAQPDCCMRCGPRLCLLDGSGTELPGDPIEQASLALKQGRILAIKGLGGFHLSCLAANEAAVAELRRRKHRDEKPLALMCRDVEAVRGLCMLSDAEAAVLQEAARPIVLLKKKDSASCMYLSDNACLGIMLPYTPLHHLLMEAVGENLVMTSANLSDLPIIIDNAAALDELQGIADGFLLHNREIVNRCDDSLLWIVEGEKYFIRRSRGYAPLPLPLAYKGTGVLACGAEQKAGFALSKGGLAFPSPHIGDLKTGEALENYEKQLALYERLFDIRPEMLVCDLHPDYLSTDYAEQRAEREGIPLLRVQHHHAHMASCMADNGLEGQCIGVIWDGTGLGTDGSAWGGEFLIGGYDSFVRAGSIRPMRLPGGDRAVREIWRIGAALLKDAGLQAEDFFPGHAAKQIEAMLAAGINAPKSSGMGRLFDGACAIMGIRSTVSYEGQGAVLLEAAAEENCTEAYPWELAREKGMYIFDYRKLIAALAADRMQGVCASRMAVRFMNTLVDMARMICTRIRRESGLNRVVLSGGVFQNMYLLGRLTPCLREAGFELYIHRHVSTNDEGIAYGQLAAALKGGAGNVPCGTAETD